MTEPALRASPARPQVERAPDGPVATPELSLAEVVTLAAIVLFGLGAWSSLALAHAGRFSAEAVIVATTVVAVGVGALVLRRFPVRVRLDLPGVLAAGAVAVVAAAFAFPGFPYGLADKDPGAYMTHAHLIERTGAFDVTDPVLSPELPDATFTPGARFPGIWINDAEAQHVVPQFYHLFPAALAAALDVGGRFGVVNMTPALAVLAAVALTLAVRRAFHPVTGVVAGLLLATNMMQVWSAKNPQTEVMAQLFFVGAVLGLVLAIRRGWPPAAGVAGLLTGLTFLARPDGILLVMFAVAVGAALFGFGKWDRRATAFAVGLGVTLPHGLYQAYDVAERYSLVNDVPEFSIVAGMAGLALVAAAVWRWLLHDRVTSFAERFDTRRLTLVAGAAIVGVAGLLVVAGFARPAFGGDDFFDYNGRIIRSYDEENLLRLSWFFTPVGIVAMWAGLAVVALQRWRAAAWAVLVPAVLLLPVYVYEARISPRLMWWTRRYVPIGMIAVVVLIAVAVTFAVHMRGRRRQLVAGAGAALAAAILAVQVSQSWPLRSHDEFEGSFAAVDELDVLAGGEESVFLWVRGDGLLHPARVLGAPLWFNKGHTSALLPPEPAPEHIAAYRSFFDDAPLYVVAREDTLPGVLGGLPFEQVHQFGRLLPFWEEGTDERPDEPQPSPVLAYTVWELQVSR